MDWIPIPFTKSEHGCVLVGVGVGVMLEVMDALEDVVEERMVEGDGGDDGYGAAVLKEDGDLKEVGDGESDLEIRGEGEVDGDGLTELDGREEDVKDGLEDMEGREEKLDKALGVV